MVAPNSPSARAQHSTAPAATPGADQRQRDVGEGGPPAGAERRGGLLVAAVGGAQRTLDGDDQERHRHERLGQHDTGGGERQRDAERARRASRRAARAGPKTSSSATPPTTGGSTSGTVTRARTSRRPGNSTRASTQASGTPSSRHSAVARVAVCSDSRSAVSTPGSVSRCGSVVHGARTSSAGQRQDEEEQPQPGGNQQRGRHPPRRRGAAGRRRAASRTCLTEPGSRPRRGPPAPGAERT